MNLVLLIRNIILIADYTVLLSVATCQTTWQLFKKAQKEKLVYIAVTGTMKCILYNLFLLVFTIFLLVFAKYVFRFCQFGIQLLKSQQFEFMKLYFNRLVIFEIISIILSAYFI